MPPKGQLRIRIVGDADGVKPAMSKAVGAVAAGAAAMGAAFIAGVSKALDVEAASDKMAASLGLSAEESKRLGGIAGKLYADAYGDSIETVSGAVESVISSIRGMRNASTADVQAVTASVLDMANAFEMEAGRAAQVAGQLITTGLARDATHALDLMTAGLQRVPKAIREDLVDALDEYSPFFQSLGVTGEKSIQLLVNASQKGMYGIDKLGDSLKEFTIRATDMSTASKVGFDALGLSQEKMAAKFLAGGETARGAFDQIITGLRGIKDPVKQSQAALALFGTPLEDLSVSEIPKFLASLDSTKSTLGQVSGAADRMGDALNNNAKTNLTSFWRTAQMVFVDFLGGKVIPIITSVAGWLKDNLGPAVSVLGGLLNTVLITPLRGLFDWLNRNRDAVGLVISVIAGALVPFLAYKGAIVLITGAIKVWTAVTKGLAIAQAALNLVMMANPIGIIITLIAGLVAGFIYLWNKSAAFRDFWKGIWKNITDQVGRAVRWIKDVWRGLVDWFNNSPLGKIVKGIFNGIKAAIGAVIDSIGWLIDKIGGAIDLAKTLVGINATGALNRSGSTKFGGGKAIGGQVTPSKFYVVGERGPELFFPGQSGRVMSNVDSEALMAAADRDSRATLTSLTSGASGAASSGSGGGTTVVNNFSFPNYVGSREDLKQVVREAVRTKGRGSVQRAFGTSS
jgi:phage-related minor tail protein